MFESKHLFRSLPHEVLLVVRFMSEFQVFGDSGLVGWLAGEVCLFSPVFELGSVGSGAVEGNKEIVFLGFIGREFGSGLGWVLLFVNSEQVDGGFVFVGVEEWVFEFLRLLNGVFVKVLHVYGVFLVWQDWHQGPEGFKRRFVVVFGGELRVAVGTRVRVSFTRHIIINHYFKI